MSWTKELKVGPKNRGFLSVQKIRLFQVEKDGFLGPTFNSLPATPASKNYGEKLTNSHKRTGPTNITLIWNSDFAFDFLSYAS